RPFVGLRGVMVLRMSLLKVVGLLWRYLFLDLFLHFSALSVLAVHCALALLESVLPVLALIFGLWDVIGSYPAKGAPFTFPQGLRLG
ncbi:hypothetical protein A2U01_0048810, partial [Trifolium medium]|nr:hypothetical protein [Trifolium medium]